MESVHLRTAGEKWMGGYNSKEESKRIPMYFRGMELAYKESKSARTI